MMKLPPEEEKAEQGMESDDELVVIEQMMAKRAPYDEVVAALGALVVPDEELAIASVAHTRLSAVSMYERPDHELARAIERYIAVERVLWRRLSAVLAACSDSPELFRRYAEPVITEGQTIDKPDSPLVQVLEAARKVQNRLFGATGE